MAICSLTGNASSPFHAEPAQVLPSQLQGNGGREIAHTDKVLICEIHEVLLPCEGDPLGHIKI